MNQLKFICRNLSRHRLYTVINITGLFIAFTAALLMYGYVVKEWRTDRFHENKEDIYRVTFQKAGNEFWESEFCSPMAEQARQEIPGVKNFVRVTAPQTLLVKPENSREYTPENPCRYADFQLFQVFSFPLVQGDTQIPRKYWIVISEKMARKYFGKENPLGKEITIKKTNDDLGIPYHIAGIMKNIPDRSSIQADFILDFSVIEWTYRYAQGNSCNTFLQIDKNVSVSDIEKAIPDLEFRLSGDPEYYSNRITRLQPLKELHLHSGHIREFEPAFILGSPQFNLTLSGITLLILFLAACNYLMIKLAQIHRQANTFTLQKCLGAENRHILLRIMQETGIHLCIASLFTLIGVYLLHPHFVLIISPIHVYTFHLSIVESVGFLIILLLFTICVGGILYLHYAREIREQKIKKENSSSIDLKKMLMFIQICIFGALLFCSVVLFRQMAFIRNKPMGFDSQNVLCIEWEGYKGTSSIKEELLRHPDILSVSNGRPLPIGNWSSFKTFAAERPETIIDAYVLLGDLDYIDTYRIELVEGRKFLSNLKAEERFRNSPVQEAEVVVNQKLVKQLDLKQPIGSILDYGFSTLKIVGIVNDFHYESLYQPIKPVIIGCDLLGFDWNLSIRYREGKRNEVVDYIHKLYRKRFPIALFHYSEYPYSQLYEKDIAFVRLIYIFTGLALFIGGMGIFAFSVFMAENKRKEIALRKVNGASEREVVRLLNSIFLRQIIGACLISLPIAYFGCKKWLEGFAYKTDMTIGLYIGVVVTTILIVMLTTNWQIVRAARANPVETLKKE
ncbi:ABC transporter permease [Gabonibacter chumensis]|uniref:ABC transporter permease n=1 Tax=Gabonibacter chumensis TaxID=2972474 RepID=UPI0025733E2A|nr:ABC transporter permease [Gabonibacter chumensis]MCR9013256.1 ABC transporter permease [Gabonibacter chumensis]